MTLLNDLPVLDRHNADDGLRHRRLLRRRYDQFPKVLRKNQMIPRNFMSVAITAREKEEVNRKMATGVADEVGRARF